MTDVKGEEVRGQAFGGKKGGAVNLGLLAARAGAAGGKAVFRARWTGVSDSTPTSVTAAPSKIRTGCDLFAICVELSSHE